MSVKLGYYADLRGITLNEKRESWIHAGRPGEYQHPQYGLIDFTVARLQRFADSIVNKIRGIDADIDYDHKTDVAHGGEAAGWVRNAEVRADGLWLLVEWTATAASKIKEGAYRYFSPEFWTEWQDAAGKTFQDVLVGGGITNRPFLKNLVPINLSELVFDGPGQPKPPQGGKEVDVSKLAKAVGLAETATEDEVMAKLTETFAKLATPPAPPTPPVVQPILQLPPEMIKLGESNPAVAGLIQMFEGVLQQNKENALKLVEQAVTTKLNEFDNSKLALTPVAKDAAHDIAMELSEPNRVKFFELLSSMRDGQTFVVELGERGAQGVNYTRERSPGDRLDAVVRHLMSEAGGKLSIGEATEKAVRDDPTLYTEYRQSKYIAGGNMNGGN